MSARPGSRPTLAILTYHSLDDSGSPLSVSPRLFAEQMDSLRDLGVRVAPLSDARLAPGGPGTDGARVAITFDDGFENVYEHALPILQRHRFAATVFLVTDYCGKSNSWPSQPPHVERRPLLSWARVREMAEAGVAFGSHTRTHPDLRRLPPRDAEEEMVGAKKAIEDAIGRPVDTVAYPYGAHDSTVRALARSHFVLACSTRLGYAGPRSDPLALERLDVYYVRRPTVFRRLLSPDLALYLRFRQLGRDLRHSLASRGWRLDRRRG